MATSKQNQQFLIDLLAIFQAVGFGKITPTITLHGASVVKATFEGWKRKKYFDKNNDQAIADLGAKIHQLVKKKHTGKLTFEVDIKDGLITDIFFKSLIEKKY